MPRTDATHDHDDHPDLGFLAAGIRVFSSLTLFSRFAGLARELILVRVFGASAVGSAFYAAFAVPNLFRRLFGEGALSAAFLPEYTTLRKSDPELSHRFASLVVWLMTLTTGAITLIGEVVLLFVLLLAPADAERSLSIKLIMLMLPIMPMVCLSAVLGGVLQVHGRFAPSAAAPIILNAFMIVAGLAHFIGPRLGLLTDPVPTSYVIGIAAVLASIVQVAWSLWALRGRVRWTRVFTGAAQSTRTMFKRFVPVLIGLGTLQLNTMMDTLIAMWPNWVGPTIAGTPYPLDVQANSILTPTTRLYQFPLGVFGIAVATAVFPLLSRNADDSGAFASTLRRGLRLSLFIGLPASVGLVMVRHDLTTVMFGGGDNGFGAQDLARAAAVLMGFAPGVWAYSLNHVLARAFYARGDTITPMRVGIAMVALNLCLNLTLIWSLREAGLAWATSTAAMVQTVILMLLAHRSLRTAPLAAETSRGYGRTCICAALMGACVALPLWLLPEATSWLSALLRLLACLAAGAASFVGLAFALRAPELRWLLKRGPAGDAAAGMSFE